MVSPALSLYQKQKSFNVDPKAQEIHDLICENFPLVKRICLRIKPRLPHSVSLDELISAGVYGLIDAANKFNPDKDASFKTYAELRIRGAILDELRGADPLTRTARKKVREFETTKAKMAQEIGREPKTSEVAEKLGWSKNEISKHLKSAQEINYVEFECLPLPKDNNYALNFQENEGEPFYKVWTGQLKEKLAKCIHELPEKQKQVVVMYYQEEMNYKEIAMVLSVTDSRVSQIHSQAIKTLGKLMEEK